MGMILPYAPLPVSSAYCYWKRSSHFGFGLEAWIPKRNCHNGVDCGHSGGRETQTILPVRICPRLLINVKNAPVFSIFTTSIRKCKYVSFVTHCIKNIKNQSVGSRVLGVADSGLMCGSVQTVVTFSAKVASRFLSEPRFISESLASSQGICPSLVKILVYTRYFKESLNKLIPFMVRRPKEVPVVQAYHERNQHLSRSS
jgi:hypothetical protein